MADFLRDVVFAAKHEVDTRSPLFSFPLPDVLGGGTFGFLFPSISFWLQMLALMGVHIIVSIGIAAVVYKFIIQRRGSTTAYLCGYGFVIPFALWVPFYVIQCFDLRNQGLRMNLCFTPLLVVFRCLEAMYNTSPPVVESTLKSYCMYYASVIEFVFDAKECKVKDATGAVKLKKMWDFVSTLLLLGAVNSFVQFTTYSPFGEWNEEDGEIARIIDLRNLGNNLLMACVTQLNLSMGTKGASFMITVLSGKETIDVTNNAIFASSSVSDFWGRRWNQLIHGVLKRGVFKPLRAVCSRELSAVATFGASGLIHEYVLVVLSCYSNKGYTPSYGLHLAFFCYNGVLVMLEYVFIGSSLHQKIADLSLPAPVVTAMVIGTALPIAHWFTDEFIRCGMYEGIKVGCPILLATQ